MTSRILNRFNIKTDRLLRSIATDKLSCDIHPRKMIKMVRRVSRDHIIISDNADRVPYPHYYNSPKFSVSELTKFSGS